MAAATIDDAVAFFVSFFDAEHDAVKANLTGARAFPQLNKKLQSMIGSGVYYERRRIDVAELKEFGGKAYENSVKALAARPLLLVTEHDYGKRKIYCAYAEDMRQLGKRVSYAMAFWAIPRWKIVAVYWACASCGGSGKYEGVACGDCLPTVRMKGIPVKSGKGWHNQAGERKLMGHITANVVGEPTAVRKLVRPTEPACAEHFDSLETTATRKTTPTRKPKASRKSSSRKKEAK